MEPQLCPAQVASPEGFTHPKGAEPLHQQFWDHLLSLFIGIRRRFLPQVFQDRPPSPAGGDGVVGVQAARDLQWKSGSSERF